MHNVEQSVSFLPDTILDLPAPAELKYMAYTGQYELVNEIVDKIPERLLPEFLNKDVLNQTIWGSLEKIKKLKGALNFSLLEKEKERLLFYVNQFTGYCDKDGIYPRELFESIIQVSESLINIQILDAADELLLSAFNRGISKYPALKINAVNKLGLIHSKKGNIEKSLTYLTKLAEHPYLIPERNLFPEILYNLSHSLLKNARLDSYYNVLFYSLRLFYTDIDLRQKITNQIRLSHKSSLKLLIKKNVLISDKMLYLLHWIYFKLPDFSKIKLGMINKFSFKILLSLIYISNFVITPDSFLGLISRVKSGRRNSRHLKLFEGNESKIQNGTRKNILLTRAMGGIGDFLMMTPGISALKKKYPKREIHLAIPKRYFSVFENNSDVNLVDVENDEFSHHGYKKWFNLSECPASRVESLTTPKIKKNRINLFARGLGIKGIRLFMLDHKPKYFISEDEKEFADEFWKSFSLQNKKVVGVQIHSDESYRDYPHMEELVKIISRTNPVIVFDNLKIKGYNFENVIKIDNLAIRQAFSIAYKCDLIIAPDSSFIHFAAAFSKPTIGLFGPVDGKIRTKDYPNCTFIDVRDQLGCLPCWRNESIPCKLTGLRNSVCMESISVQRIKREVDKKLMEIAL